MIYASSPAFWVAFLIFAFMFGASFWLPNYTKIERVMWLVATLLLPCCAAIHFHDVYRGVGGFDCVLNFSSFYLCIWLKELPRVLSARF